MSPKKFECNSLKKLAKAILEKYGLPPEKSAQAAEVILAADTMGIESHGIQRIGVYVTGMKTGRIKPKAEMTVIRETPVSALLDANDGMGQPAGVKAMELAIAKAGVSGIGLVMVRNSNHFGIGGFYTLMAANAGLLGICMTNTEAMVVPTFGRHPMMGTNPIAVSMPAYPAMFHFDISTSVVPAGKIEVFARRKQALPDGWSVGVDGAVNTDPDAFLKIRREKTDGGLLPLGGFGSVHGGHKGYALSMLVELMTGILADGRTSNHVREVAGVDRCCHCFLAIDYGMFGDKLAVEERLSVYLREVRESAKAAGHDRIYTHGEAELEAQRRVAAEGVPVSDAAYAEIAAICDACGVDHRSIMIEWRSPSMRRRTAPCFVN